MVNELKQELLNNLRTELQVYIENKLNDKHINDDELNTSFYSIDYKKDINVSMLNDLEINIKKEIESVNIKMNQNIDFLTKLYNNNSVELSIVKLKIEFDLKLQDFKENILSKISDKKNDEK